jgi:type VI secretion system protein ImpM
MPPNPVIATTIGFFGKLPGAGDFVVRGFDRPLVAALTSWTDMLVSHLKLGAGDEWTAVFDRLQPVAWVAGAGVCGAAPFAGLIRPSMDRVGRRYPLIVGLSLPPDARVAPTASAGQGWFDYLDGLVYDAWSPGLGAEALAAALAEAPPFPEVARDVSMIAEPVKGGGWHVRWSGETRPRDLAAYLLDATAGAGLARHSLFWTGPLQDGGDVLIVSGMPTADQLLAMAL